MNRRHTGQWVCSACPVLSNDSHWPNATQLASIPVPMRAANDARSSLSSHYYLSPLEPVRMFELTVDLYVCTHHTHRRSSVHLRPNARSHRFGKAI